jgi:hypothetical protein
MALAMVERADKVAASIASKTGRRARLACFTLYADEAIMVPETDRTHAFKLFQFKIDPDVRGRFAGLLFFGADDDTIVRECRMGERDAWCTPLSAGLYEVLDWAGEEYPSPPIDPGMQISVELVGRFVCVAFLVLKDEPTN